MRLLVLSNKMPYPPKDGGAIATLSLAKSLAPFFSKIDLLVINTKKHYFNVVEIPESIKKELNFYDVFLDTSINFFGLAKNFIFSNKPYNAQRFIDHSFNQKLKSLLSENKYDIVQFEGLYVLSYISTVRNNSKAIISYRAHNIEHEIWFRRYKQLKISLKKFYIKNLVSRLKKFEKSFINKYDLLIPITDRDAKKFDELGNFKKKITIPTGLNQDEYENIKQKIDIPTLFFIGALDWPPNQDGLVWFIDKVLPTVLKKIPNLKFYIAGRNAPDWMLKKIKKKSVVYMGEVESAKRYVASKGVMIVPLFSGSGMRIKIIEGMALSKAIITTSIGLEGINAENNKQVIIANTKEEMTEAIINLSNDILKIKQLGENAQKFVFKNFNNFVVAKKLFSFYSTELKIRNI